MNQKESYYAALERQRAGEATIRDRFQRPSRVDDDGAQSLESLYTEVGMKAFFAFNNLLEWLGHLGSSGSGAAAERIEEAVNRALTTALGGALRDLALLRERIERMEQNLAAVEAGMRRIDKFTLEAFRNIQELQERLHVASGPRGSDDEAASRGRLPKEDAVRLALEAARRMKDEGRRLTLASVAREAGLKYGQIVYAFGNKDGFLQALKEIEEAPASASKVADENGSARFRETATA